MAQRFAKVSEEKIEEALFYPSDLVNNKTTISLRIGEERSIYTSTLHVSVYIHLYSPLLRGIAVYYPHFTCWRRTLQLDWTARHQIEYRELKIYCCVLKLS